MGKHLKDIVEDGFSRLEELADRRRQILSRAQEVAIASLNPQNEAMENKLNQSESALVSDMNEKAEQLLHELKETLEQASESNRHFLNGVKENLEMRLNGTLSEILNSKSNISAGVTERLDSLFNELEKDSESAKSTLNSELNRLISELEGICKGQQTQLLKSQSQIDARVSIECGQLKSSLSEVLNQVLSNLDKKRSDTTATLVSLYQQQKEKLNTKSEESSIDPSAVLSEQFEKMKSTCAEGKQTMVQTSNKLLQSTLEELTSLSRSRLATLDADCALARDLVSRNLETLQGFKERMSTDHELALSEREKDIKNRAAAIYMDMITMQNPSDPGSGSANGENLFVSTSIELKQMAESLNLQLSDLLQTHSEGLTKLLSSAVRSYSNMMNDFRTQLLELLKEQEEGCIKKEQSLEKQLVLLEGQIAKIEIPDPGNGKAIDGGLSS